ncbi:MAG TPA: hypothetical protein VN428_06680 [Bryobacteraceae bacterium]|nr:hypothetical protein [Bryobacteraceae bacterium]
MDLKVFYRKLQDHEAQIAEPEVVVVSNETADGGKPGVHSEVRRRTAARMLTDGTARLATPEEAAAFRERAREARDRAENEAEANKLQIVVTRAAAARNLKVGTEQ